MPKILCLATTGFGKTTSALPVNDEDYGIHIKGLNPNDTTNLYITLKEKKILI